MDNIFEINKEFDFKNLNFSNPILTNNNYFSKISHGNFNKSLYIKLNKCFSKNGIVKTTNKCICELNYIINENNNILEFFENLEKFCLNNVINNKNKWFYNSDNITNSDIEELITPTCKSYKYGKNILVKTNIVNNKVLIYDEYENIVNLENFTLNSEFIPLIHINGIKFLNRSLVLDIVLKQILILSPPNDFDNECLLITKKISQSNLEKQEDLKEKEEEDLKEKEEEDLKEKDLEEEDLKEKDLEEEDLKEEDLEEEDLKEEDLK